MGHMEELKQMLSAVGTLADKDFMTLTGISELRQYKKGDFLLERNTRARFTYYMLSGSVREFFCATDGREFNKAFCFKGDFTGSYYDLNSSKPSLVDIQALTDVTAIAIAYKPLKKLIETEPIWLKFAYHIAHVTLIKKLEKEYHLLCLSASERYKLLRKENPLLEQLVPAYHLASYLGITPVSLSRIRSQLQN